ncbi:hypothetical protein Dimus_017776 [Dionaea muscipula]
MDLVEEAVKELEDKEVVATDAKPQTYRIRKKVSKSKPKRQLIVSQSDEEEVVNAEIAAPQDDVVITSRDTDEDPTRMEIVLFQAPSSSSRPQSTFTPLHDESTAYVDMSAHIE